MSKVEALKASVEKAEAKVEKIKGTIERHKKGLEKKIQVLVKAGYSRELIETDTDKVKSLIKEKGDDENYWGAFEVENKRNDIKGATRKLAEAEAVLENWKEKLAKEEGKDSFIKIQVPQVIIDFLEDWKAQAFEWHVKRCEAYPEFIKKLEKEVEEATLKAQELGVPTRKYLKENYLDYSSLRQRKLNFAGAVVLKMREFYSETERLAYLDKVLEAEKKAKIIDLVTRIKDVTGEIVDAKGLRINGGNLNGFIIGEIASASVNTIGAGGWNIQCFHFRTLVKKL